MKVIVVGAGAAGLAAAYALRKRGLEFTVLEAADRAGGRIAVDEVDGFRIDTGAQVFAAGYDTALRLCRELGVPVRAISRRAGIWSRGAFRVVDQNDPWRNLRTLLAFKLFSPGGLWQLLRLGWKLCYPACEVSLKSACKMSHIGAAAVEWLRRRWVGLRGIIANGSFAVASPPNGRDAMIGRETRVLLRHYLEQGLSKAAVARLAGVSRRTVHRWIAAGQLDRDLDEKRVGYGPRRPRPSGLDPYKEIIKVRLAAYPALSAVRLFEEIREAGYEGGYDQVRRHVSDVRPRPQPDPVQRFETPPGHQGQVDFAEFKTPWGKRHALVVVLGYSRLMWVRYYERQTMAVVMEGLESAFRYFGGVPSELLFDQMKAVIVEDNREVGGRLMENTEFLRFAFHWGFRIRACRPYRARTKGKVERPVSYLRRSFFYGRDFVSDDDLNARVLGWLDKVANVRVHGTLKERPVDRFEVEKPHLKPLARWPYRPVAPLRPEPSEGRDEAAADSRFVEVERRPLAEYARIAGGAR